MFGNNRSLFSTGLILLCALAVLPTPGTADDGQLRAQFEQIIESRCTLCHTRERVDRAIAEGRDLQEIQTMMLQRGAVLTERDKSVLGTFWGTPLKEKTPRAAESYGLGEYFRIIDTRCTECHSRKRIEEAIRRQLPFETVEEILLKRGVVLSERERQVLGTFWGNPLR